MKYPKLILMCIVALIFTINKSKAQIIVSAPDVTAAIISAQVVEESSNLILDGVLGNLDEFVGYAREALKIANGLITVYGASKEFINILSGMTTMYNQYFRCLEIISNNIIFFTSDEVIYIIKLLDYATFAIPADAVGTDRLLKGLENIGGGALDIIPKIVSSISSGSTISLRDMTAMIKEASQTIYKHQRMTRTMEVYINSHIRIQKYKLGYFEDLYNTKEVRKRLGQY